jgi:hypothetical protein
MVVEYLKLFMDILSFILIQVLSLEFKNLSFWVHILFKSLGYLAPSLGLPMKNIT